MKNFAKNKRSLRCPITTGRRYLWQRFAGWRHQQFHLIRWRHDAKTGHCAVAASITSILSQNLSSWAKIEEKNTSTQNKKQKQGAVFCFEFTVNNFIARWWSCGNALSSSQMFTLATNKLLFERSRFVDRMTSRTRMPWRNWFSLCAKKRWAENMQQQKKIINPLKLD